MNDMLRKLLVISEASETSCKKALDIAKGDFVKAIHLAIKFDNELEQRQQIKHKQQTEITQLARDLEIEIEICAKFLNNINFDIERARKLFQLNDHMRKSTRLSPIDFAQLLETHQYHIQSVEKAIRALQPKRTINLCGEYLDKKSID